MSAGSAVCAPAAAVRASASSAVDRKAEDARRRKVSRLRFTLCPRRHRCVAELGADRAAGYDRSPYAKTKGCIEAPMAMRTRLLAAITALICVAASARAEDLRRATVWDLR